jgi:hypothetical protein
MRLFAFHISLLLPAAMEHKRVVNPDGKNPENSTHHKQTNNFPSLDKLQRIVLQIQASPSI